MILAHLWVKFLEKYENHLLTDNWKILWAFIFFGNNIINCTVRPEYFKQNCNTIQQDLRKIKVLASGIQNMCVKSQLGSLADSTHFGCLADGLYTLLCRISQKYILNPWSKRFNPAPKHYNPVR